MFQTPAWLTDLEDAGLVHVARDDATVYLFKHALIQDAVYASLLKSERKHIHALVARALEQIFPNELDQYTGQIATHYAEAGLDQAAFDYTLRASQRAISLRAYPEARVHFARALELLANLPPNATNQRHRADVLIGQASVSLFADDLSQLLARLDEAEALLDPIDSQPEDNLRRAWINYWRGRAHYFRSEMPAALAAFRRLLNSADQISDPALLALPNSVIGRTMALQGYWKQAQPLLQQSVEPLAQAEKWYEWTVTLACIGMARMIQGDYARGVAQIEQAIEHAKNTNHPTALAAARVMLGFAFFNGGEFARALEQTRLVIAAARSADDPLWVYVALGLSAWANARQGKFELAFKQFAEQDALVAKLGGRLLLVDWFAAARAETLLNVGRIEDALTVAERAVEIARKIDGIYAMGIAHRVWGSALAQRDHLNLDQIEPHLAQSLDLLNRGDARVEAARTRVGWGKILRARGDANSARAHFDQAAMQFEMSGLALELDATRALCASI